MTGSKDEYYGEELSITNDSATWPEIISQQIRDYLVKKGPLKILSDDFPSMLKCTNLQKRLSAEQTIDKVQQKLLNQEKIRCYKIFKRLFSVVQFLAERNIAFRGSVEKLGDARNGNFIAEFNKFFTTIGTKLANSIPYTDDKSADFQTSTSSSFHFTELTYDEFEIDFSSLKRNKTTGYDDINVNIIIDFCDVIKHIIFKIFRASISQGMFPDCSKIRNKIIERIKKGKYFATILGCTPDISHKEQIQIQIVSFSLRYVLDGTLPGSSANLYEQFIKFIHIEISTGENLFSVLKQEIQSLGLKINDIRWQGYDNGSNIKGKFSGVQARLLKENSRAFFTPCTCHSYNLLLGDVAKIRPEAITFFDILQRLYVLFSTSTKRWSVLFKYVNELTVNPTLSETSENPQIEIEAESLGNLMKDYKFLVTLDFWYDLLFQINFVSKKLQCKSLNLSTALSLFEKLLSWLINCRNIGFEHSQEKVQRRATKLIPQISKLCYEDRLAYLKIPSLIKRRQRGDIIQLYRIFKGYDKVEFKEIYLFKSSCTRGHNLKYSKEFSVHKCRENILLNRAANY
nr:uncharacterized protein LOC124808493 [Hydra vulgaris]